jgi:hypothetical protein
MGKTTGDDDGHDDDRSRYGPSLASGPAKEENP